MNSHTPTRKEKLTFPNENGDALSGLLERPAAGARAFAVFAPCFTCPREILAAAHVSHALAARGFGVLRFDFTGFGESGGDPADVTFATHVRDVVRAADYLRDRFAAPALLVGHSLGGTAVLSAARAVPEAVAVATLAAPGEADAIGRLLEREARSSGREADSSERDAPGADDRADDRADDKVREMAALARARLGDNRRPLADFSPQGLAEEIRALGGGGKALLVLHSPRDELVGLHHARRIFEAATHPKSFVSLDRADHLLSRREDAEYAGEMIASWAERYLEVAEEDAAIGEPEMGEVLVSELDRRFSVGIRTHRHRLLGDEPMDYGGADTGPSPYELLLAALGSCTAMTIRMYANHKKLPLERVSVRLEHEKVEAPSRPEGDPDGGPDGKARGKTRRSKVDRITREIHVTGDLTPEQRQRIATIADRCPVHRTIHSEIDDRISVVSP